MSDHWEEVGWDKEALTHANVTLKWYLDGQVAMLEPTSDYKNHHSNRRATFLVPMYGGIWIMCVSLTGKYWIRWLLTEILTISSRTSGNFKNFLEKFGIMKQLEKCSTMFHSIMKQDSCTKLIFINFEITCFR